MSSVYDNWERLVGATLKREHLRELAMCPSISSSTCSDFSQDVYEATMESFSISPYTSGTKSRGIKDKILFYFLFKKPKFVKMREKFFQLNRGLLLKKQISYIEGGVELNLSLKLHLSEILHATRNFDTKLLIGKGGFGKVYKGMLSDGTKVSVKRSEPGSGQGLLEFQTEIMVLSKIRHKHLVSLIGYCDERDEMIVVYEFMEKGTLRDHLYNREFGYKSPSSSTLSWDQRVKICVGAAEGIQYLHTGLSPAIIHRDIKSTNILLDENYVAKVDDLGISRSIHLDETHVSTVHVKGSFGYIDPEYFECLRLTKKSDVYSFGVVLLEVLCARPAVDPFLSEDQVILANWGITWIKKGQLEEIVDPLLKGKINPDSLRKFGETVEKCLQESGADRPNMIDVLWDLEYSLKLQHAGTPHEPYKDSTTDVGLPMMIIQRLPSHSAPIDEDESCSFTDTSDQVNASEVFSLLKIDREAR